MWDMWFNVDNLPPSQMMWLRRMPGIQVQISLLMSYPGKYYVIEEAVVKSKSNNICINYSQWLFVTVGNGWPSKPLRCSFMAHCAHLWKTVNSNTPVNWVFPFQSLWGTRCKSTSQTVSLNTSKAAEQPIILSSFRSWQLITKLRVRRHLPDSKWNLTQMWPMCPTFFYLSHIRTKSWPTSQKWHGAYVGQTWALTGPYEGSNWARCLTYISPICEESIDWHDPGLTSVNSWTLKTLTGK